MKMSFFVSILSCLLYAASPQAAGAEKIPEAPPSVKAATQSDKTNLNTADSHHLSNAMKGIGPKRAEAIVKYRETHPEGFKSIDDLSQVPGLGKNFVKNHIEELQKVFTIN